MFGVVASGSPSSSWIAFRSGGCGFVRNFSHIKPGRWINVKPMRVGVHPEATMRTWGRPFSSDNGSCGRANVDEPIAQIETDKLLANEGDTVEPGDATHVAPFKSTSEKAAPKPTQKDSEEKKTPKVETTLAEEKPKAPPSTLKSPTETQLPLKETERRVDR
ncbi:hypothetical protein Fmac_030613 [Flemingia macrophylla]|uniref:Uncharacterized protein n=1 Tax=Flemingia macrophylla TaxID=520843 RepID=A0ABD1KZP2_9FABA